MAAPPEPARRLVSLDEVVARVARSGGQPLYGPYPTADGWMPHALFWGLYGRLDQLDALAQVQAAQAVNIGMGGGDAAARYQTLHGEAVPNDGR